MAVQHCLSFKPCCFLLVGLTGQLHALSLWSPGFAAICLSVYDVLERSSTLHSLTSVQARGTCRGLLTVVWSCPSNCTQCTLLARVPPLPQLLEQALQAPTCHTFWRQGAVAAARLVTAEEQLVAVVAVPALVRQVPAGSSARLWPLLLRLLDSLVQAGSTPTRQVLAQGSRAACLSDRQRRTCMAEAAALCMEEQG